MLEPPEIDFVRKVFGDSLDFERIRVTNMVGLGGRPFTLPTIDNHILINIGVSGTMFDAPTTTGSAAYPTPGQLRRRIDSRWQIQHATLAAGYVPGFLRTGIDGQVIIGSRPHNYGDPGPPWDSSHNEAQAHIVDERYAGTGQQTPGPPPIGFVPKSDPPDPRMNPDSRYFGYIDNDIRTAEGNPRFSGNTLRLIVWCATLKAERGREDGIIDGNRPLKVGQFGRVSPAANLPFKARVGASRSDAKFNLPVGAKSPSHVWRSGDTFENLQEPDSSRVMGNSEVTRGWILRILPTLCLDSQRVSERTLHERHFLLRVRLLN